MSSSSTSLSSPLFLSTPPLFKSTLLSSNLTKPHTNTPWPLRFVAAPASPSRNGSSSSSAPETGGCPVPPDQRPVNEYEALAASSWAAADLRSYCSRLAFTGAAFALLVGLPVAAVGARDAGAAHLALGSASAGLLAVTLAVVRMYLGWAYVGNRLLSATVEYEETGWYDGQIWVKTPEVLARDRLLGSFSVKPVLSRVKLTLVGLGVSLIVCVLLYINTETPRELSDMSNGRVIPGAYNDATARSFEPDAFCGEPDLSEMSVSFCKS